MDKLSTLTIEKQMVWELVTKHQYSNKEARGVVKDLLQNVEPDTIEAHGMFEPSGFISLELFDNVEKDYEGKVHVRLSSIDSFQESKDFTVVSVSGKDVYVKNKLKDIAAYLKGYVYENDSF